MVVYKLWMGLCYLKVPFRGVGGCGEKEEIVGWLDFVLFFQKFALVCYYRISRKGKQSSEEIPTVEMQPSLEYKHR